MNIYNYLIYVFIYFLLIYNRNFVESRYNVSPDDNDKSSEVSSGSSELGPISKETVDNVENGEITGSDFTESDKPGTAAPLNSNDHTLSRNSQHTHQPSLESQEDSSTSRSNEYHNDIDTSNQSAAGAEDSESSSEEQSTSDFTLELSSNNNESSNTSSNLNYSLKEDENNPNEYYFDFNKGSKCSKITLLGKQIWAFDPQKDTNYPKSVIYKRASKIVVYFDNSIIYYFKSASGSWKDKLLLIQLYGDRAGDSSEPKTSCFNTTNDTSNNSQPHTPTHLVKLDSSQYEINKTGTGEYKFEFKTHKCTEVRLEGTTLWKYDPSSNHSHPDSISYKDDKIIIYINGTYITFEKGTNGLWNGRKFDIELFTRASDDSTTNVGLSESHYELRESGDEFNYEFKSSSNVDGTSDSNCTTNSACTEIKCQNKYVWKRGDHGIESPLSLSYNKKDGHISIRDDKNVLFYRRDDDDGSWKFYMGYPTDTGGIKLYSQNDDGSTCEMDSKSYQLTRDPKKAYILGYSLNCKCTEIKQEVTVPDPNDPTKVTTSILKVWDPNSSELDISHTDGAGVDSNASSQEVTDSSTQDSHISTQLVETSGSDAGSAEITSPEVSTYPETSTMDNSDEDIFSTLDTSSFPVGWHFELGSESSYTEDESGSTTSTHPSGCEPENFLESQPHSSITLGVEYEISSIYPDEHTSGFGTYVAKTTDSSDSELPKLPTKITFDTKDNVLWVIFDKSYVAYMYIADKWVKFSLDLYIF